MEKGHVVGQIYPTLEVPSMLPLMLKDGLLLPYVVTSLAFLYLGLYLLSALDRSSEEDLRLGSCHKLTQHCLSKHTVSLLVKIMVSDKSGVSCALYSVALT
ncbi:hypothetical protein NFI96_001519 [Prochilodus magdalenae]|nr:hypothetical protein NFI96_001519 [Prochilodus magdalenae]